MQIPPAPPPPPTADWSPSVRGTLWTAVFAANLPLPGLLGWIYTSYYGGTVGMLAAVVLLYAVGLALCVRTDGLGPVLIRGGTWVALGHIFPIMQLGAGVAALWLFDRAWMPERRTAEMEGKAFAVTVVTGMILAAATFVLGGGYFLLRSAPTTEQVEDYG